MVIGEWLFLNTTEFLKIVVSGIVVKEGQLSNSTPDGKVYVSGQMQRHVLFQAINKLNDMDRNNKVIDKQYVDESYKSSLSKLRLKHK